MVELRDQATGLIQQYRLMYESEWQLHRILLQVQTGERFNVVFLKKIREYVGSNRDHRSRSGVPPTEGWLVWWVDVYWCLI